MQAAFLSSKLNSLPKAAKEGKVTTVAPFLQRVTLKVMFYTGYIEEMLQVGP